MKLNFYTLPGVATGLLIFLLAACAPVDANQIPQETIQQPSVSPGSRPTKICYSSGENQSSCYRTLERAALPMQIELYKYQDPYTSTSFPRNFDKKMYIPPDRLVDLRNIPAQQLISPHFGRDEVMPENAQRGHYGLFSTHTLKQLENLRERVGRAVWITSGYRSPGHNNRIDRSAEWSRHMYGDAVDFKVSGIGMSALAQHCQSVGATFTQIYNDHVHCDWRSAPPDPAFYPDPDERLPTMRPMVVKALQAEGEILLHELHVAEGSSPFVLEARIPQEDEGELLYEWEVVDPRGKIWASQEPLFQLPAQQGQFDVTVKIGGSVTLNRKINIP